MNIFVGDWVAPNGGRIYIHVYIRNSAIDTNKILLNGHREYNGVLFVDKY